MGSAQSLVAHLIDLLNRECAQLKILAQVGEQERIALKCLSIDRLNQLNQQRTQSVQALASLEQERAQLTTQLARLWNLHDHDVTLSSVVTRAGATDGLILQRQHQRLQAMTSAVHRTIQINQRATAAFLEFTQKALGAWQKSAHADGLYASSGDWKGAQAGGDFLVSTG